MATSVLKMTDKDMIMMKLSHYFITEKNYNPIILHGINDEIWLENMDSEYRVIRIVGHYIHNNEQLNFDKFKLEKIVKTIKRKTLSFKMNVLSIYIDLGDSVTLTEVDNYKSVFIKKISDLKNPMLVEVFPDIIEKTKFEEKGLELMAKITNDINTKNIKDGERFSKIFDKKYPIVTYGIMTLCAVMFLLTFIYSNGTFDNITLLSFGANLDILTKGGDYFRLIASAFLHIGFFHMLVNMYSLFIIGPQVESFFGKWKYLGIYVISAISGSLLSIAFNTNVVSAGASGAIFGLLGALLYFGYHYRVYLGNAIRSQIVPVIIINLIIGFSMSGIDNAAHIGGLIGGLLAAMAFGVPEKSNKIEKVNGSIVLAIFICFLIYMGFMM